MNLEKLRQEFWQNGYLALDDFFNSDLMDEIDKNIRNYFGDNPEFWHEEEFLAKAKTEVIPWFPQNPDLPEYSPEAAAPFDRVEADQRLQRLTRALLGDGWGAPVQHGDVFQEGYQRPGMAPGLPAG